MEPPVALRRILVVDDEEAVRSVLVRALGLWGYAADGAADGREAMERVSADPGAYAGVLLDLTMPGMNGDAVFIGMMSVAPDLPVLLMSGYGSIQAEAHFNGAQPAGFLQKPFDLAALRAAVERLVGG